jgi:hypothetical protein
VGQKKYQCKTERNQKIFYWEKQKYNDEKEERNQLHEATIDWEKEKYKDGCKDTKA